MAGAVNLSCEEECFVYYKLAVQTDHLYFRKANKSRAVVLVSAIIPAAAATLHKIQRAKSDGIKNPAGV